MKRLKLVLSCYACEPNRGSEPGVGWAWALGMAKRHETYVLTRANNRGVIEAELARQNLLPSETPNFIYVDLSPLACRLKKRGIIPVSLYYLLWQFKARKTLDSLHLNADIIHHVTFNSFVCPGVWWNRREKVILGPLGGMSVCPPGFLRVYRIASRLRECFRGLGRRFWRLNIFFLLARRHADAVIFTEQAIADRIGVSPLKSHVMLETAVPEALMSGIYDEDPSRENQMVWAGTLEPHKACEIALRAYSKAFQGCSGASVFTIFGKGSQAEKCRQLAHRLKIDAQVRFCGAVSQAELWNEMRKSKALVFTSVRDTSGNVALEAMALQTPVVCFNHQGVGMITDDTCAIRLQPSDWDSAVAGFASAMKQIASTPERAARMGQAGRNRVLANFTWDMKFDTVTKIYEEVLKPSCNSV